jgi:hypothetical protein
MVITGGKILVEWGDTARRLPCHSMRKSLLSSLFGLALQEGRLHTSQTLEELGIDDNEPAWPCPMVLSPLWEREGISS